jgi:phosphoglycolate phosphatase-like HAD superfamily hydrolase
MARLFRRYWVCADHGGAHCAAGHAMRLGVLPALARAGRVHKAKPRKSFRMKTLVLGAMGVIFAAGDDVVELLCPFIHEQGGISDNRQIVALYHEASLGHISAREFWARVQVDPQLEDSYLRRHRLSTGFSEVIRAAKSQVASIWCLSNDVPQWSRKLRDVYDLHDLIDGFLISGDIGARKPDPAIYHAVLSRTGVPAENIVFVAGI